MSDCANFLKQCGRLGAEAKRSCLRNYKRACPNGSTTKKFSSPYMIGSASRGYYDGSFTEDQLSGMCPGL